MCGRGLLAVVLIGALANAGCGSGPPAPPPAPLELDEFVSAFGDAYCHRVYTCCGAGDVPTVSPGTNEAGCAVEMTGFARSNATFLLSFHGIVYDAAKASQCLAVLRGGACPAIFEPGFGGLLPCHDVFPGSLGAGDACDEDEECLSVRCDGGACTASAPLVCSSAQFLDETRDLCLDRHGLGEACTQSSECAVDQACLDGVCGERLADGAACDPQQQACVGTCQTLIDDSGRSLCRPGYCHGL